MKFWILANLWNLKSLTLAKFQNFRSLTLDHKISFFDQNWTNLMKILSENRIFEILNPKIKNLTKSQNLKSLTLKSKIFNFDKIWPKIKIPPRSFIITLRFHQNSKVKIFQNLSQYGRTSVTNFFQNFEVDIKITKIPKIGSISPNFVGSRYEFNYITGGWSQTVVHGHPPSGRSCPSWATHDDCIYMLGGF